MAELTTLGARLRGLRRDAGLTMATLAKGAGISTSYLNDIEHERTVPTLGRLVAIGGVLDRTAVELLRGVKPYDG